MYEGPPRLSVIRTRATSIDLPPATTRSANAVASAARTSSTNISNREAVRNHDRLGRAVAGGGEQFERAATVGPGAVAQMAKRAERGIGEPEHARVYPNARSSAAAASKTNACVVVESGERPSPRDG
jgi:hypothetical protein